jgi:phenylalanyl-tRNA synthetase alpha chain
MIDPSEAFIPVILHTLSEFETIPSTLELSKKHEVDHQEVVVSAVKKLEAAFYVVTEKKTYEVLGLTEEGEALKTAGKSPEMALFLCLSAEGIESKELEGVVGAELVKFGLGPNMKNKWAKKEGTKIVRIADPASVRDSVYEQLMAVADGQEVSAEDVKALSGRKLVTKKNNAYFAVSKGAAYSTTFAKQEAELTMAMVQSGDWKSAEFKDYNFAAMGAPVGGGYFHPLLKVFEN